MEDQGKRLLMAVALIGVLYAAWTLFFTPKTPEPTKPTPTAPATQPAATQPAATQPAATQPAATQPAATQPAATQPAVVAAAPAKECVYETEGAPKWSSPDWVATFTRCGGALKSFELLGSQYTQKAGDNKRVQMDLVRTGEPSLLPLRALLMMPQVGSTNPEDKREQMIPAKAEWSLAHADDKMVRFVWVSPDEAMQVTKTYTRLEQRYAFRLDLEVKNVLTKPGDKRLAEAAIAMFGYQDPQAPEAGMFTYADPLWGTACYVNGSLKEQTLKDLRAGSKSLAGDVRWVAMSHQYFMLSISPLENEAATCLVSAADGVKLGTMLARLSFNTPAVLEPNQSFKHSLLVYAGPKILGQLEAAGNIGGKDTKLVEAVDLGWFGFLARPMLALLKFFHGLVANWGIAIILLTITVKLATLYWTTKSMRSMKNLAKLKPEMDEIRAKYANDKQRLNVELMNMYKRHQISPFGGCLPMLLQMPVWIALFQTLRSAAELYQAPFAGWIKDLTAPDPIYVLPIVMTLLMFLQAKIQPAAVDSQQQKIMQWVMPAMFGFMSLVFPSGLALYMLTNSLLSIAHQQWMNRTDPPAKPAVAVAAATTSSPSPSGPGPSSSKKDKHRKKMAKA